MKKIFLLVVVATISLTSTYANNDLKNNDDKKPVKSFQNHFKSSDTWFGSAAIGAQVYFGDHDTEESFGKRLTPKFGISVGKWFSEEFGARINLNTAKMKGLTQVYPGESTALSTGKLFSADDYLYHQTFNYISGSADFLFNWTNDAYGYDPERLYNLIPYAGVGFFTVTNKQKGTNFMVNLGVLQTFKIHKKFNVHLDVRGNVLPDKTDGERGGRKFEGILSMMAGVSYSFK